jgi:murein DD-endopeptidase MepM/ murein hydrolase activator NlpD
MRRRSFLLGGLALTAAPMLSRAAEPRLILGGSLEQGSLVIGKAAPGATVRVNGESVSLAKDGTFAFGFEWDQKSATKVAAQFADGTTDSRDVTPIVRKYEVQSISGLPEKYVAPPPDIVARIKRENARVAEARRRDTAGDGFAEPFDWPVPGIVSGLFGSQRILNGVVSAPHFGVDIAAPEGTPIRAPAGGTVVLAEPDFYLTGGTTVLDHGHGVFTVYIHQSALKVAVGQSMKRGEVIGLVGMKGRATGPHLHWGLNWFQMRLDPSLSARTPAPAKA